MSKVAELLTEIRNLANQKVRIVGPTEIAGKAHVQGSKNAANKLVAVTVALPGKYQIRNFPFILDPLELLGLVEFLGGTVEIAENNTVLIDTTQLKNTAIPYAMTKSTTSAFGFAGALLGRFSEMTVGKPGGDKIGPRPVDLHLDGFRALGATVTENHEEVSGQLNPLTETKYFKLRMPSTGAAVNFILAVAAAGGRAHLENAPQEDSDMDAMYRLIRAAGVQISTEAGAVDIDATNFRATEEEIVFECSSDRNDAFTWLAYGALSKEGLRISGLDPSNLGQGLQVLESLGVHISREGDTEFLVKAPAPKTAPIELTVIAGLAREFHSDWAPFLEVVATTIPGHCRVVDILFAHRVRQAELLQAMGANVQISGGPPPAGVDLLFTMDPNEARYLIDIHGPSTLEPITTDVGYDVRACAAMVMAASQAHGTSTLGSMQALHRGYENVVARLQSVGLNITTV